MSSRLPVLFVLLTASMVENCWLKTNSECKSLCDTDLRNPDNSYVEAVVLDGDIADFGCLSGISNIKKVYIMNKKTICLNRYAFLGEITSDAECEWQERESETTLPITEVPLATVEAKQKTTERDSTVPTQSLSAQEPKSMVYPYPLVRRNQTSGCANPPLCQLVTLYPHLPSSIAPIPESVLHPKRPTQIEKGPRYDFHAEDNSKEEKSQSTDVYSKTSVASLLTSQSASTITNVISEMLSSLNGMKNVKLTEIPIMRPETNEKVSKSQSRVEDQMNLKIQRERKFKHLVAIVAPLVSTFIFFTGLAIGVIILVWQLDWVVLQRL